MPLRGGRCGGATGQTPLRPERGPLGGRATHATDRGGGEIAALIALHIRRAGSPNERFALLFRDWFRAHPGAVDAYGAFKLALSQVCPDVGTYADAKDPMVDVIVIAAEEWAAAVGWQI